MPPRPRMGGAGDFTAASLRSQARRALRRAAARIGPIARLDATVAEQRTALADLEAQLAARRPDDDVRSRPFADFFDTLAMDGDCERAAVTLTRALIGRPGGASEARIYAQVLQQNERLRPIAEICLALCALAEPMPDPAWTLFTRNDTALVLRWTAEEYFRLGFERDPGTAADSLRQVLAHAVPLEADPHVWIEIALASFAAGEVDLAEQALRRADDALGAVSDPERLRRLRSRVSTLAGWLARASQPGEPVERAADEVAFALIGYGHPDWASMSTDPDDFTDTLIVLGHLVRQQGVRVVGDQGLSRFADRLRAHVPPSQFIAHEGATIRLYQVDRDASGYAAVPDGTWTIVSEWFTRPIAGSRPDMPLQPALRPVFVSFHIAPDELRAPGVVEYLRDHGPVGCRDWDTVFLLHAAGVQAFFSGALAMTADTVAAGDAAEADAGTFVDVASDGDGGDRVLPRARQRDLADNLAAAHADLCGYRHRTSRVVTTDVRFHLALRALGCATELRLTTPEDYRALDFVDLTAERFAALQQGLRDKLAVVLAAIAAGGAEQDVYDVWREACEPDLAATAAELARHPERPRLGFDLAEVCAAIRATTVVSERTQPGPDGSEINVEFSVDDNYKHQLDIVLDSIVQRASRPIRAFVLCRGYGTGDFERMARLFPTVSFVWLQTDRVDYGNVRGKIKWATIVTMDRTILPELLGDVERIVHFDLDALCLGDLAELYDTDLEETWIAAVDEPQPTFGRGFASLRDSARLLRSEGRPDLAREYLIRTHSELAFDFEIFNAGIMVLDLAAMREGDFCGRYLGYVPRFGINGQRILNVGVGRDRKKVDAEWNRLLRLEVADSAKVAHWAGPYKPWAGHPYVVGRQLWRDQERAFANRVRLLEAGS